MHKMDKYEFNLRIDQIKKKIASEDFETAMKIADTIDWRRVRNVNILSMVSGVYEKNGEYQEAKDILLLAFERAPIGKRLLYKLAELAIKEGSTGEAEDYYREFCDLAPEDPRQYILRYLILGAKGAPVEQLIHTLEQYCNVELDEKWLYELAELYNAAHMEQLCVMTCDKIMLMFGTGKYVDKAIDLKVQYAPLTSYQMDLMENKDKYEARLKEVEKEYDKRKPMVLPIDAQSHDSVTEETYGAVPEPVGEADYESVSDTSARETDGGAGNLAAEDECCDDLPTQSPETDIYAETEEFPEETDAFAPIFSDDTETEEDDTAALSFDGDEGAQMDTESYDTASKEMAVAEDEAYQETVYASETQEEQPECEPSLQAAKTDDDMLRAHIHEAEVQEDLAKEMSRLAEEHGYSEETQAAQTQILTDIRHLKKGPVYSGSNHLMIEAEKPEEGFELAVKTLKRIHQETGAKNQAAKITGSKLNHRGIFTLSDKLTGKDLIIEQAGDMNEAILQELNQLMARDETGMSVVLIDTAERLEELHRVYPGLAKRFECIGISDGTQEEPAVSGSDNRPVRSVELHRAPAPSAPIRPSAGIEISRGDAPRRPSAFGSVVSEDEMPEEPGILPARPAYQAAVRPQASQSASEGGGLSEESSAARSLAEDKPDRPSSVSHTTARSFADQTRSVNDSTSQTDMTSGRAARPAAHTAPVSRLTAPQTPGQPQAAPKRRQAIPLVPEPPRQPVQEPETNEPELEMDIDEFAKYACEYAGSIDCSISGKSMLALYERIEIMEEDGERLTKAAAEALIEEAADRAENPTFFKKMTGIFSSKYDKAGLLVLKEEHFI